MCGSKDAKPDSKEEGSDDLVVSPLLILPTNVCATVPVPLQLALARSTH